MCKKKLITCNICTNENSLYTFFGYIFYSSNYIYQFDCGCYKKNKRCCFLKVDDSLKFICKECFEKCNNKCPFCRKENIPKKDIDVEIEIRSANTTEELVVVKNKDRKFR